MKKIYTLCAAAMVAAAPAVAQQLPNNIGTFDGTWVDCKPDGTNVVGKQPEGWMASNVYKHFFVDVKVELISSAADRQTDNSENHSVDMQNKFAGSFGIGATAPGYITLGSSWAYGDITNVGKPNDTSDGGSYGSIEFTNRPDAISLYVKRSHGTDKATENASVIFYQWKGSTTSTVKTGLSNSPVETEMVDRDKDVLGMITDGVTKSDDFELISKSENYFADDYSEWTQLTYPIEYLSENEPTKLNIIISASDYFNRANLGEENSLSVDDVTLVYYSTLSGLTIGDTEIELSEGVYNYSATGDMPASADAVVATTKGKFAKAEVALDQETRTVTITVTNQGGADLDGETSHTYVVTYSAAPVEYSGYLNIKMMGGSVATNQEATVTITETGDNTCTFSLPNFSLGDSDPLGDIVVENVSMTTADGVTTYTGSATGISLAGGEIMADATINGTITETGVIDFKIDVIWTNGGNIPINVTFTSEPQTVSIDEIGAADATAVYGAAGAIVIKGYTGVANVYSITGQLVKSVAVDGDANIDVVAGIYVVRTGNNTAKVVVK